MPRVCKSNISHREVCRLVEGLEQSWEIHSCRHYWPPVKCLIQLSHAWVNFTSRLSFTLSSTNLQTSICTCTEIQSNVYLSPLICVVKWFPENLPYKNKLDWFSNDCLICAVDANTVLLTMKLIITPTVYISSRPLRMLSSFTTSYRVVPLLTSMETLNQKSVLPSRPIYAFQFWIRKFDMELAYIHHHCSFP